ncbi:MAG: nucleotidyltransferase family protein [Actinomycetota bacterium]|nr:nucleotidyltransferase family protein [Actinomycetota bacterium]
MEALLLAGGKGERLGNAAQGRPKPLVHVAGVPLAAYAIARFAEAGVERVVVACAAGQEELFESELAGLGPEIVAVGEREPLGRGGGLRRAAAARVESGPVIAANGDEILDVDPNVLLAVHRNRAPAATIVVAPLPSAFGVVELGDDDAVVGFHEAGRLPHWVNAGLYVLEEEAIERLPERGDHETTSFPELAAERRLAGFRHEGLWLTVNTPKDLRHAEEFLASRPDWRPAPIEVAR